VRGLFPRALLDRYADRDNEYVPDRLGNLTLLARSDNELIGDAAPELYLQHVDPRELTSHLIPHDPALWTVEAFKTFCEQREREVAIMIRHLLAELGLE